MTGAWLRRPAAAVDAAAEAAARERQVRLTKPPGALGRIEEVAVTLAALQGTARPRADNVRVVIVAADHGVATERVSAYPQAVTMQMLRNFAAGGAAAGVLATSLHATLEVVDAGTLGERGAPAGVVDARAGPGTANLAEAAAMTPAQLERALRAGCDAARRAWDNRADVFIGGDLGIGNTTAAAAMACALLSEEPRRLVGPGTGLDADGIAHKVSVVERALHRHRDHLADPLQVLRRLGGFEIAALAGAYLRCAQHGTPVLVDGFITSVAALAAARAVPGARRWFLFAHRSAEPGHGQVLRALGATPLLDLGLRLGEGSGALLALPLLRLACAVHAGMATFEEAGVSVARR